MGGFGERSGISGFGEKIIMGLDDKSDEFSWW